MVSKKPENDLSSITNKKTIDRISSEDRTETNSKVINKFYLLLLNNLYVTKNGLKNENELVDSLTVGVLGAREKSPVMLVANKLSNSQKDIVSKKKFKKITKIGVNGNESAFDEIKKLTRKK
ncbi:cell wall-binding repeat-containing protein [Faecalimicrobium sp. JNUCC 81]